MRVGATVSRDLAGRVTFQESSISGFNKESVRIRLKGGAGEVAFETARITWNIIKSGAVNFLHPKRQVNCESFDADKVGGDIVLRHWQPGDRFQPIGLGAAVKLQDLFTNQKVPQARRHGLMVGALAGGEIFWVEGLRLGENFKLDKSTRYQLKWRWKGL